LKAGWHLTLQAVSQPLFKLVLRALRHFQEADARLAGSIGPRDFAF
jgi:hypothetical protein